jgi:hypothetical protein
MNHGKVAVTNGSFGQVGGGVHVVEFEDRLVTR